MNINELSDSLGVSTDTIDRWVEKFNFEIKKDSRGRKQYTEEVYKMLLAVKSLREQDNGLDTISRKLGIDGAEPGQKIIEENAEVVHEQGTNIAQVIQDSQNYVITALKAELESITELTRAYGAMSHRVGSLEAQLEAEKEKTRLIADTGNKDLNNLKKDMEKGLNEKEREIETLKKENSMLRQKKWWQKIFSS